METQRQRHGFITFWLWLGLVINALGILYGIHVYDQLSSWELVDFLGDYAVFMLILTVVSGALMIASYALLLNWNRSGFWLLMITSIGAFFAEVIIVENYFYYPDLIEVDMAAGIITPVVAITILYLILQIKKDGVSYWDAMGNDATAPTPTHRPTPAPAPQPANEKKDKFCPNCGARNLATSNFCTSCGAALIAPAPAPTPTPPAAPQKYDVRHIKDINNIVPYSTINDPQNHIFYSYLHQAFQDCSIQTKVSPSAIFPGAPSYAMPINFLITKGNKKLAVLLMDRSQSKRYSHKETLLLCQENGLEVMEFYLHLPNEEEYVVARIKKVLG